MKNWVEQCRDTSGYGYFGYTQLEGVPYHPILHQAMRLLFRCHRLDISCGANYPSFRNPTSEVNIYPHWNSISPPRTQSISSATLSRNQTLAPLEELSASLMSLFASGEISIFVYYKRRDRCLIIIENRRSVRGSFDLNTLILPALIHTRIETNEIFWPPPCRLHSACPYCSHHCIHSARSSDSHRPITQFQHRYTLPLRPPLLPLQACPPTTSAYIPANTQLPNIAP